MTVVVDTSALFAVIDPHDERHADAVMVVRNLADSDPPAIPNYVVAESLSLVHRRLGMVSARTLQRVILSQMTTLWTTPLEHAAAADAFLEFGRALSFVDCATMATMRARNLDTIFAFDADFARAGFQVLPTA